MTMRVSSESTTSTTTTKWKQKYNQTKHNNRKLNTIMSSAKAIQQSLKLLSTATLSMLLVSSVSALNATASPSYAPSISPSAYVKNLQPASELQKVETITMTLTGVTPLSEDDIKWFQDKTEGYIIHYYNVEISACSSCLQKDFDIAQVQISVSEQDPPYVAEAAESTADVNGRTRQRIKRRNTDTLANNMNANILDVTIQIDDEEKVTTSTDALNSHTHPTRNLQVGNKVTVTYSQLTSYQKVSANIPDPNLFDIVKEPFNNISKRRRYKEFIKAPANTPEVFKSLSLVSAPTIIEKEKSFWGIGVISAVSAGGLIFLALSIFLIYRHTSHGKDLDSNANNANGKYDAEYGNHHHHGYEQEQNPASTRNRKAKNGQYSNNSNGHRLNEHPSQVHLPELKDEVSTMVDPAQQYGVFSAGGKSLTGYHPNGASVASFDPDYVGIYSGTEGDQSIISSADGTMGSHTLKSKFSTMESILTPGVGGGGQSIYTEDEQSFENHLRNRNKGPGSGGAAQREEYFDIYAPGGKLGVVIDTPNSGAPVVHNIKETCPIADQLRVGDKLIAVDDEDVRSMTAVKVSKLISQKSNNPTRKFTISRVIEE